MNQRLLPSLLRLVFFTCLFWFSPSGVVATAADNLPTHRASNEATFTEGLLCLKNSDIACAKIALLKIPTQQIYAKILDAAIAASENDVDKIFHLLLPIQVSGAAEDPALIPQAVASLHASLALAYDQQADPLRSLEQRILAQGYWLLADDVDADQIRQNQQDLWNRLIILDQSQLIEMRGGSFNTDIQGWIDLALTVQASENLQASISDWRMAYPDHGADTGLILQMSQASAPASADGVASTGNLRASKVALLLPFGNSTFYPAADAIEQGFMAAKNAANDPSEVIIYPTTGDRDLITAAYEKAVNEGADFVIGPLTRDEVTALTTGKLSVPTLALNQAESNFELEHLYGLGLSVDTEAAQIARMARDLGMQTAVIVAADNAIAARMAKSFEETWLKEGGQLLFQANIDENTLPSALQAELAAHPADMILLATDPELARSIRGYLDITTPTFGLSHIYTGINYEPEDAALLAVQFTDLPWILNTNDARFSLYKETAANLPEGMMQRWFALGVDAYQVFSAIAAPTGETKVIHGLTGRIQIGADGSIERTLALGRFSSEGVVLEHAP